MPRGANRKKRRRETGCVNPFIFMILRRANLPPHARSSERVICNANRNDRLDRHGANRRLQTKVSIETQAAKALDQRKTISANETTEQAKRIAAKGDSTNWLTLLHYQQAAPIAMQSFMLAIASDQTAHADRKAV